MTTALLEVRDLTLLYGDAPALSGVSFDVAERSITAIIGANGAGKTSLIRSIAGILRAASGTILFRGQDITTAPSHVVCDLGIGQVAEGRQVFPTLTVQENLEVGGSIRRARAHRATTLARVLELFPRLAQRRRQAAGTLSGGEQQMLAIGRCLMGRPELVMFDEPSLGLAPAIVREVFRVIRELASSGLTIILVEQNVAASLHLAAHAHVLETGRIVLSGTGTALLNDPGVRQAYLGL
jgi:branched-chain amino acid transport system ATP-binding protein